MNWQLAFFAILALAAFANLMNMLARSLRLRMEMGVNPLDIRTWSLAFLWRELLATLPNLFGFIALFALFLFAVRFG
ncbi:hypothetical protein [Gymnodinialimonas ulvae]|uniref:hypothetical protein n=1 Tax=Gymnodinialimonas ulvae TaxID=3126504 RepID=UPI0030B6EB53